MIHILNEPTVASYGTIGALYAQTFAAMGLPSRSAEYPTVGKARAPRGSVVLHNTLGFRFQPVAGAVNIAVPFHEWSRYPAEWAERLNGFDQVWAASESLAAVLKKSGVTTSVKFVPPALTLRPPARKKTWRTRGPFRFLFVGEPHFRKGHHLLIEGFRRLGAGKRATLTIKTSDGCAWDVADKNIQLIRERWSRRRLDDFYAQHDAFVSASLAEGLGLGVAEAILARVPVATNLWGGHTSLLTRNGYVKVAHRVVPQPFCSQPAFFAPGQECALSAPDAIASAMERLMTMSASERESQAYTAAQVVEERFGIDAVARRLRRALLT